MEHHKPFLLDKLHAWIRCYPSVTHCKFQHLWLARRTIPKGLAIFLFMGQR